MPHPIARHLYDVSAQTGDPFFRIFDDWLGLAVAALSQAPDKEQRYMTIMRRYGARSEGRPHPADHFSKALGAWLLACQELSARERPFPDILGRVYEEESVTNRFSGQFFTPEPICQMMSRMLIEPTDAPISIADPACGSGRFFIAAQPLAPKASFFGIDRDLTCVHMAVLNMLVRNARATIIHGNTLSLECFAGYVVHPSAIGASVTMIDAEAARAILLKAVEAQKETNTPEAAPTPASTVDSEPVQPKPFVVKRKGQLDFGF